MSPMVPCVPSMDPYMCCQWSHTYWQWSHVCHHWSHVLRLVPCVPPMTTCVLPMVPCVPPWPLFCASPTYVHHLMPVMASAPQGSENSFGSQCPFLLQWTTLQQTRHINLFQKVWHTRICRWSARIQIRPTQKCNMWDLQTRYLEPPLQMFR